MYYFQSAREFYNWYYFHLFDGPVSFLVDGKKITTVIADGGWLDQEIQ